MDRNKDLETCNEGIKYQKLCYIADVCNWFLLSEVICPWVCSEFIHKVGYVDIDTVIQLFIKKLNVSIVDVSKLSKYNTHTMTISNNPIMNMVCGYTILIGKYYQKLLLWMDTLAF